MLELIYKITGFTNYKIPLDLMKIKLLMIVVQDTLFGVFE